MPDLGLRVYRPTRKLRQPPPWLTPAQKTAYVRQRVIESFVNDFAGALPRGIDVSVIEFPHYCTFAKQVWKTKDQIQDPAQRDRQIDLKVDHWSEVMGLKELILRLLVTEILKTDLAAN